MKYPARACACFLLACSIASAQSPARNGFRALQVDAGRVVGEIRTFQGVNGAPAPVMAGLPNLVQQYKELRINVVRTHDLMGPADVDAKFDFKNSDLAWLIPDDKQRAAVVEAGNRSTVFPDINADPERPESYNFAPTDRVLADILASGATVFFRVGRSWGANSEPPANFDKYASAVKHIAMHYNQGWANGFHYDIKYWEFWNEPDGGFWSSTPTQFYPLYEKTARALKSVDPTLKVGGVGLADPTHAGPYREGFLDYCAAHQVPLDFYSWHTYARESEDAYGAARLAGNMRSLLNSHGFPKAESILSEWNLSWDFTAQEADELRGAHNAAFIGAVLTYLQDASLDAAIFYRGDAAWMGLFDLQGKYYKTAYAFKALGQMLDTPRRLAVTGTDTVGFAALAGRSADGKTVQILISNYAIPPDYKPREMHKPGEPPEPPPGKTPSSTSVVYHDNAGYDLAVANLPWGNDAFTMRRYRISTTQNLDLLEEKSFSGGSFKSSNPLPTDTLELIVLQRR
jgi:xylan 1,4-beta-xylosidase